MLLGWSAPLLVAQILWIHLICDGPSDIVLGFEPKEEGIVDEKPKPLSEPIPNRLGLSLIGIISVAGAMVGLAVLGGLLVAVVAFLVPGPRQVLGIVPLHLVDWLLVIVVALGLLIVVEAGKADQ